MIEAVDFQTNVEAVKQRINQAAQRVGRKPSDITLVAVTKTHPLDIVKQAYQVGLRYFGENRVEESGQKTKAFAEWQQSEPGGANPVWHFIGHVQTRQVPALLEQPIALLHGVDSLKLAERIDRIAQRDNRPPLNILLQCNVSGEESKSGFNLFDWSNQPQRLAAFMEIVQTVAALDKVTIRGVMTMAPFGRTAAESRPTFQQLAALHHHLQEKLPAIDWGELSMGMTNDFEIAIEEGATLVRVGRALFGERPQ